VQTAFCRGNLREGDNLEDTGTDGRIIFKWILEKWDGGHGLNRCLQDRDRWWALVNVVMHLQVPQNAGNFLSS
jgi:hypothetical protein